MNQRTDRIRETRWFADRLFGSHNHRAIVALTTASLELDGADPGVLLRRARAFMALGLLDEAEVDLDRVAQLAPRTPSIYLLQCEIALRRGNLRRADKLLATARALSPQSNRAADLGRVIAGWKQPDSGQVHSPCAA